MWCADIHTCRENILTYKIKINLTKERNKEKKKERSHKGWCDSREYSICLACRSPWILSSASGIQTALRTPASHSHPWRKQKGHFPFPSLPLPLLNLRWNLILSWRTVSRMQTWQSVRTRWRQLRELPHLFWLQPFTHKRDKSNRWDCGYPLTATWWKLLSHGVPQAM